MSKKSGIFLDMTAMCDVAFLLLTFFMLTTNFKNEHRTVVDIPSSSSQELANEENSFNIIIREDSLVFFSFDNRKKRGDLLLMMGQIKGEKISDAQVNAFAAMPEITFPFQKLKTVMVFPEKERKNMISEGVPVYELEDWISAARAVNPEVRVSVRGDKNAPFGTVDAVLRMLQEKSIYKFDLVTTLEK